MATNTQRVVSGLVHIVVGGWVSAEIECPQAQATQRQKHSDLKGNGEDNLTSSTEWPSGVTVHSDLSVCTGLIIREHRRKLMNVQKILAIHRSANAAVESTSS